MQISLNRYQKSTLIYTFLTILLLVLIFKFGLTAAVKVSEFLQRNKPLPQGSLYENLLPAPQLYPLAEATNSATLPVAGYSQPNGKVDIYLNDLSVKTLDVDSEGKFAGELALSLGLNKIFAVTKDNEDRQSSPSRSWSIFYQDSPPSLEILEPVNGSIIRKTNTVTLKGKVEATSKVTINDHQVVVDGEGLFNYPLVLQDGENKFKIICTDPAQNKTEMEWALSFQP